MKVVKASEQSAKSAANSPDPERVAVGGGGDDLPADGADGDGAREEAPRALANVIPAMTAR